MKDTAAPAFSILLTDFGRSLAGFGLDGLLGAITVLVTGGRVERKKFCAGLAVAYGAVLIAVALSQSFLLTAILVTIGGLVMTASVSLQCYTAP